MDCLCDDIANEFVEYLTVASFAKMRRVSKRWQEFIDANNVAQSHGSEAPRRRFFDTAEVDYAFSVFCEEQLSISLQTNRFVLAVVDEPFEGTASHVVSTLDTICAGVALHTWGYGFYDIVPIPATSAVATLLDHCLEEQQQLQKAPPSPMDYRSSRARPIAPTSLQNFVNTVGFIFSHQGLVFAPYSALWQKIFSPQGFRGNLHRKVNDTKETRSALSSGGSAFRLSDFLPPRKTEHSTSRCSAIGCHCTQRYCLFWLM